ncbi:hypothetical protein WA026_006437 [Henosepilachna vigintioctopunctata]|uniref:Uncharacterized protein n=1 Tax=Henosepilachna vigintioctopunctata TaxID=420089 RepID=A0AAW1TPU4_9CUCU
MIYTLVDLKLMCVVIKRLNIRLNSTDQGETAIMAAKAELTVHKKRATKFYASIREVEEMSKNEEDALGLTVDYTYAKYHSPAYQFKRCPITVSYLFYPFCIKNFKSKESRFFLNHEGVAMKGPNETCTFLLKYIQEQVPDEIKKLYIFTDGCDDQNRNQMMMGLCPDMVDTGRFDKIDTASQCEGAHFCQMMIGLLVL